MSKKLLWSICLVVGLTLIAFGASSQKAQAENTLVTSFTVNDGYNTETGETADYEVIITFGQTIPVDADIGFGSWFNGWCPPETFCGLDFSEATISGLTGDVMQSPDGGRVGIRLTSAVTAGAKTITIGNVNNPAASGMYILNVEVRMPGQEGPGETSMSTPPIFLGDIAVKGQVTKPGGIPVSGQEGVGVNVREKDGPFNYGTGLNDQGYFAIPVVTDRGAIAAGKTYMLDVWAGQLEGFVSPDPVTFIYSGNTLTKNLVLVVAKKTINVSIKYQNGDPVTTANVWANNPSGGSGVGGDVDENGEVSFAVAGGRWEVRPNCPWDQENNMPMDCDWNYQGPGQIVEFAKDSTEESADIVFTVQQTNAKIKGTVKLPDGTLMQGGFVDIRAGEKGGFGTGINNGSFQVNVLAGDYKIMVWPDQQNPDLAKYYSDEIAVRVGEDETITLAITMKEKTSAIKGKVVDTDGNGVAGVWINGWLRNTKGGGGGNTQSGANGSFTLWMPAGEIEYNIDQGRREEGQEVHYIPADNKPMSVTLADGQIVTGIILTVQVADATVNARIVDANGGAMSNMFGWAYCYKKGTNRGPGNEFGSGIDRGTASIYLLGDNTYICGLNFPPEVEYSLDKESEVTVAAGETKNVTLTMMPNTSAIVGWIKDQYGKVIKNVTEAEVFAVEAGIWNWHPGKLNADGSFRISVSGGDDKYYMIGFHPWNRGDSELMESNPEPDSAFNVPEDTEVTKILTVFKADTYIKGHVYTPDGKPMARVWVGADYRPEDKLQGDFEGGKPIHAGTETNSDGSYTLRLVSNTYMMHSGMPPEFEGNYMSPKEVEVTVTSASPATGVDLYYREADAYVKATAVFEDGGTPDFGFCHAWSEEGGGTGSEMTGGKATLPLTVGDWFVGCETMGKGTNEFFRSEEQQITVAKGDTKSADFTLVKASFIIPESFNQTFTATQQNVFTMPDGTTVTLPQNAAGSDEGNYTFMANASTNLIVTKDTKPLKFAWNFEIMDPNQQLVETFNSNATICIPVDKDYLDELGLTVEDIFPKYWSASNGAWQTPDSAVINEDMACVQVDHLTEFALTTGATFGATGQARGKANIIATPLSKGGPQVIIADGGGKILANFFAYDSSLRMGIEAVTADVDGDGNEEVIVVPGAGAGPHVRVFDQAGQLKAQFFAYDTNMRAGIHVITSDYNGDGVADIITTTMAGAGPQYRVFNMTGGLIAQGFAYPEGFRGGFTADVCDVNGDGADEYVFAPDSSGGPQIVVRTTTGLYSSFFAYATTTRGGFNVACGDVDNDGDDDIVVSPKAGLGPQVAVFSGEGKLLARFFAYAVTFRGGVNVSVGDLDGNGTTEIVATPISNAGPQVRVFNAAGQVIGQFWAYAETLRGNFTSFIADLEDDGTTEIITAPGPGMGPHVRVFNAAGRPLSQFFTHYTGFRGGLNIFPAYE